jgi:hypothetical protein
MRAFDAWQRRCAAERIERQEDLHIAACHANTNLDDEKNNREQRVRQLQDYYKALRRHVLGYAVDVEEEVPDPQRDAFMRAGRRNMVTVGLPGEDAIQRLPG